jgi:hypothetical protein
MHDDTRKRISGFRKGLLLMPLLFPITVLAADPVEPMVVRIESIDVPAQEIRADGVDYSLSGRATVMLSQGKRLSLGDLKPGMRVELGLATVGATVVNSVVLLPD